MKNIKNFNGFKQTKTRWMRDPAFKKAYDELDIEFRLIDAMIRYRTKRGLTQKQLAQKIGTKQSAISRFESGSYNPTLGFVKKLAGALGARIDVKMKV